MDLLKSLNITKSTIKTTSNKTTTLESLINKRSQEVVHEMLKKEFPDNYKKVENSTLLRVDKDNKVKDNPTFDFNGWCVLIPQGNTTITSGKNITTIDSGFKVGVMQTYLKGAKSTICEYVKINGKKVNSLIKK